METQSNKITALYCRTAHFDTEGCSLDAQKSALLHFASKGGYSNPVFYIENGFSGLNYDRPALCKLLDDIHAGNVHMVITKGVDRIARNYSAYKFIEAAFISKGVDFFTTDHSYPLPPTAAMNDLISFMRQRRVLG